MTYFTIANVQQSTQTDFVIMLPMKKTTLMILLTLFCLSGCTQMVTAPIYVTGAVVTTTIDVADATVDAVTDDDEDEDDD